MAASILTRLPSQLIAKPLEGLGAPGSVSKAVLGLGNQGIKALTGYEPLPSRLPLPTMEEIQQYVTEPIFGKENLQPGSFPERAYERFGRAIPAIAATGGAALLPALGAGAAGSVAGQIAEDVGLPPAAQLGVDVLASGNFNKLLQKMGSKGVPVNTLSTLADDAKKTFYATERELGSKINVKAHALEDALSNVKSKLVKDTRLDESQRSKLLRDISEYSSDISGGNIPASQLVARRIELNDIIKDASGQAKNYYKAIRNPIAEVIESQKGSHPEWYKNLKAGDAIHSAQRFPDTFIEGLEAYPKIGKALKSPIAYGVASLGPALFFTRDPYKLLMSGVGSAAGAKGASKVAEMAGFLAHGREPQKILMKASQEMFNRNFPAATRYYGQLDKEAEKYEKSMEKIRQVEDMKLKKQTAHLRKIS